MELFWGTQFSINQAGMLLGQVTLTMVKITDPWRSVDCLILRCILSKLLHSIQKEMVSRLTSRFELMMQVSIFAFSSCLCSADKAILASSQLIALKLTVLFVDKVCLSVSAPHQRTPVTCTTVAQYPVLLSVYQNLFLFPGACLEISVLVTFFDRCFRHFTALYLQTFIEI